MATINALFVDDDLSVQMLAECVLKKRGINVLRAMSTVEADAILHRSKVDVIVCDVIMPKEDGLTYCQRLQREGSRVPLMFLSALSTPATVTQGLNCGAAAYLVKPLDLNELERRILKLVGVPFDAPVPSAPPVQKSTWFSRLF